MKCDEITEALRDSFARAETALERMELDLLSTVMVERSTLIAGIVDAIGDAAASPVDLEQALEEAFDQNARLQMRLEGRFSAVGLELDELYDRGRMVDAYRAN